MRTIIACLFLVVCLPASAQKWVDEDGKVYYGTPPAGMKVKPLPMTGGTSSSVGSQPPDPNFRAPRYVPAEPWQERMRNQEYARRRVEQERREREQRERDEVSRKAGILRRQEEAKDRRVSGR